MSLSYRSSVRVGFRILLDDALKPFAKKTGKDRFHMEDRYDPTTGKKTGKKEKVWDERVQVHHEWKDLRTSGEEDTGEEDVTEWDFIEKVAERNGFQTDIFGYDSNDERYVAFFPKKHPQETTDGPDNGQFEAGGNLSWAAVADMGEELMKLRKKLVQLGLKPGEPEVILTWDIS